jgi:hypothetical protein
MFYIEGIGKGSMKVTYEKCYFTSATNKQVYVIVRLTKDIPKLPSNKTLHFLL